MDFINLTIEGARSVVFVVVLIACPFRFT